MEAKDLAKIKGYNILITQSGREERVRLQRELKDFYQSKGIKSLSTEDAYAMMAVDPMFPPNEERSISP